jgi:hypothetical protein
MLRRCVIPSFLVLALGCSSSTPTSELPFIVDPARSDAGCDWTQWGQNWAHTGMTCAPAQGFAQSLAVVVFDPFVDQEVTEAQNFLGSPALYTHYAAPLVIGDDAYISVKAGSYLNCDPSTPGEPAPCGFAAWNMQVWTVQYHSWSGSTLALQKTLTSDWKPPPWEAVDGWEPVFQPAVSGNILWVPGASGTVLKADRKTLAFTPVNPFGTMDPNRYTTGPLVIDADGTLLYNVVQLSPTLPVTSDAKGYLVRIPPGGAPIVADYQTLVRGAPGPNDSCPYTFFNASPAIAFPWPPTSPSVPSGPCGSQRPGFNSAPAIGPGGTVFLVSRAHFTANDSSVVALNPDLSPKWTFRMREILNDGCGDLIPSDGTSSGPNRRHCRPGAPNGVDPLTGLKPSVQVDDEASSVPVALPDGAVLYGGYTGYNTARGHLVKIGPDGKLLATFDFGWDVTPAVWVHNGTYSIITKDNHYFSWTSSNEGPFYMSQLKRDLTIDWSFRNTQTQSCTAQPDGGLDCLVPPDHPDGFEWCVNAPAVAPDGTVYANSEDGRVYSVKQGGTLGEQRFLIQSLGAAYTPITVDSKGRIYSLNGGVMTVVGQ